MMSIDKATDKILQMTAGNEEVLDIIEELKDAVRREMKRDLIADLTNDMWNPSETVRDAAKFIKSNY